MATYFFCCSYPLANGSVVEPGNWGRLLRAYNLNEVQRLWLPLRENIFESVRSRKFPSLPSRWDAAFVCESESDLMKFMASGRPMDIAYEVELVDSTKPLHRGCVNEFEFRNMPTITLKDIEERAKSYWSGQNIAHAEIVTLSPIRILGRMMQLTPEQRNAICVWASETPEIQAVWLFGSRAKGTARPNSDVDLAVDCDDGDYICERQGWTTDLTNRLGLTVQIEKPDPTDKIVAPSVAGHGRLLWRKN